MLVSVERSATKRSMMHFQHYWNICIPTLGSMPASARMVIIDSESLIQLDNFVNHFKDNYFDHNFSAMFADMCTSSLF